MKNYITCFLLMISSLLSLSQGRIIKTIIPCNDEVLFKTPGKWFTSYGGMLDNGSEYIPFNKAQVNETVTRMNAVRDMLMKIFPEPMGVDAAWHHTIGRGRFGEQVKYVNRNDRWDREARVEKSVASYGFVCGFFAHGCNRNNPTEIRRGYPGETGTWIGVSANGIGGVATEVIGETHMLIDGYPVFLRQPLKQKFDGYELFYSKANVFPNYRDDEWRVLVHRKGELPYTPVTRKQYLDQAIIYLSTFYDVALKTFEQAPVRSLEEQETEKNQTIEKMKKDLAWNPPALKAAIDNYLAGYKTEQKIRKEQINDFKKNRDNVLKHYNDELEKTAKNHLLESPAIIPLDVYNQSIDMSIFVEENVGSMVVIENAKYMRKDLPKYIPQLFCVKWSWDEYWKPQSDIAKLILENFPFDKLQAMIDK